MSEELSDWNVQDHLRTDEERAAYLDAAAETGDLAFLIRAVGDVARAQGMTQIAGQAGVTRSALYKTLREGGDPKASTIMGVLSALNLRLAVVPMEPKVTPGGP